MNDQPINYEQIASSPFLSARQFGQLEKQVQEKHRASFDNQHKVADFKSVRTMESIINGAVMPFLLLTLTIAGIYISGWAIGHVARQGKTFAMVLLWAIEIAAFVMIFRDAFAKGRISRKPNEPNERTNEQKINVPLLTGFLFVLTILFNGISELSPYLHSWRVYDLAMVILGVLNAFLAPVLIRVSGHYLAELCVELVLVVDASKNADADYETAYRQAWELEKTSWLLEALRQGAAKNKYMKLAYDSLFVTSNEPTERRNRTNERTNEPSPVFVDPNEQPNIEERTPPAFVPAMAKMQVGIDWDAPPAFEPTTPKTVVFGQAVPTSMPGARPVGEQVNRVIDVLLANPHLMALKMDDMILTPEISSITTRNGGSMGKGETLSKAVRYVRAGGQ